MSISLIDQKFMAATLRFSRWGMGLTSVNPCVGCLIVKDNVVVGKAITAFNGRPHAETQALSEAGENAVGATVYVSLEPCSHYGQVPPCAQVLINAKVARVVVCIRDPDRRVSGRGLLMLSQAGIIVEEGILQQEAYHVLDAYLIRQLKKRVHVTLKLAVSADNMIGLRNVGNFPVTGDIANAQSHIVRAHSDAILVGIGTALIDDPELTCRLNGLESRSPIRIILDPRLELPKTSKLVKTLSLSPVIVVTSSNNSKSIVDLEKEGINILYCNCYDIKKLLFMLVEHGITSLLVEGGAKVAHSFLKLDLVDTLILYKSKKIIGNQGIPSPICIDKIEKTFEKIRCDSFGSDDCVEYSRRRQCLQELLQI
ncbi:5-amino-6-(5-phosphoribosylamino)uracil reductase [Liberibacter crescens BT-1]|uniref:Riboflavin biosynthesis protein RibD n=1 Tax=Liberibacter crescens (strain BT-1) TaxID=1215343 RepID=L0EU66_LIBCB|nr:bifunctional diaminohydroxyphosphoribosylaminopyrimidine deaminase/5-amino-6-(5-phosphoribosylamino)uracil reductase RibD [Liberibacter crescens]AGA65079.1 5-amino-6-(5-phosphoribosylamino)uracil reductase [Liberibacter crescens BT-1]AMC13066.1 5-amino-6-(5-phosphoribosylamino)uracil reductase [Liberibacter crescens]